MLDKQKDTWSDGAIETASVLLSGIEEHPLTALASRLRALAGADGVSVMRADGEPPALTVVAVSGAADRRPPVSDGISASVFRAGQPRRESTGPSTSPWASRMAVPMRSGDRVNGVVLVSRANAARPFTESDLEFLATYVDHAAVAIELAETRSDRERATLLEDRARTARDLHDTAIQQLFAAGLELRATATALAPPEVVERVLHAVELIDVAISQIRTAVLALSTDPASDSLRHRVLDVIRDLASPFPSTPEVLFDGPVDLIGRGALADDVVAVVRESLANAAKHAAADRVGVRIRVDHERIEVDVWDDGVGSSGATRKSGLVNLARRADARGGFFTTADNSPGTSVVWRVPYDDRGDTA